MHTDVALLCFPAEIYQGQISQDQGNIQGPCGERMRSRKHCFLLVLPCRLKANQFKQKYIKYNVAFLYSLKLHPLEENAQKMQRLGTVSGFLSDIFPKT